MKAAFWEARATSLELKWATKIAKDADERYVSVLREMGLDPNRQYLLKDEDESITMK